MGKCNNFYGAMLEDLDIRISRNPDFSSETIHKMSVKANLDSIAYSLANLADTLEEMNENIKNLAANQYPGFAHTDDGK